MNRREFARLAVAGTAGAMTGPLWAAPVDVNLKARWQKLDDAIRGWWDGDLHKADETAIRDDPQKSLVFLPFPYLTPGGTEKSFPEIYGWDTHFSNLALLTHGRADIVRWNMLDQLSMIERFGKVLNGNRTWFISRGQPPLLAGSVGKYLELKPEDDELAELAYPLLAREYTEYWNAGEHLTPTGLSTCWDGHSKMRLELAAEAESGLDFTAIFDGNVHNCMPIHVNVALVGMAQVLSSLAKRFGWKDKAAKWTKEAEVRSQRINQYCWDEGNGCYFEYDYVRKMRLPYYSLNVFWPLWAGIASKEQARRVVAQIGLFDQPFGMAFTDKAYACPDPEYAFNQWSYPEAWPPEQIVVSQALMRYGFRDDAVRVSRRFMENVVATWETTGKTWERYNAVTGGHDVPVERKPPQPMHGFTTAAAVVVGRIAFS